MSKAEKGFDAMVALVLLMVFSPLSILWSGYVLTVLWGWFVVPTFAVAALSIPAAAGLSMVIRFASNWGAAEKGDRGPIGDVGYSIWKSTFIPAWMLFWGWVVQHWM